MRPGCFPQCRGCRHFARAMAASGHPAPCCRQGWEGPQLHVPTITGDGCEEFEALELPEPAAEEAMG